MKLLGKVIALALLLAVVSPFVPRAYGQVAVHQPAGCHEHGQKTSPPRPLTYQCCQAGHQFAAVRETIGFRDSFQTLSSVVEFAVPVLVGPSHQIRLEPWLAAFGPPGVTSLRI
jgi:hypothetical protein